MTDPWGALLTLYFVLIAVPSGLTVVACARRWRHPQLAGSPGDRLASLTSLGLLAVAGLLLVVDLGRPERFFLMVTRFDNLGSPISLGAKVLALKGLLLVVDLYLQHRSRGPGGVPRPPGDTLTRSTVSTVTVALVGCSVFLAVYPVAVLERTWLAPLAGTGAAMLVFALSALLMGAAAQLLLDGFAAEPPPGRVVAELRGATAALLAVWAVAVGLAVVSVLGDPVAAAAVRAAGTAVGWGLIVVVAGIAVPAAGLAHARRRGPWAGRWELWRLGVAAAILAGAGAARLLVVGVGPWGAG